MPVETVIVVAAAAGAIGLERHSHEVWFLRVLLAALIATPLAFAAHRLERFGRRLPVIAGSLAAVGVLAAVSATLDSVREDAAFRWPYLLSLVAAVLVPFVVPGPPFGRFVRRFFEQTTTWSILCACGLGALAVVRLALVELFDLRIDRLTLDALIVAGCGFVLIYLHRLRGDDTGGRMPELWRRLATMIGAPFVATMLAILVVYEIVARARGELPRNVLSPLIMAAGFAGFVTTLIISSVLAEAGGTGVLAPADPHRWARRWSVRLTRAFPLVLLLLLPMAGWALWSRIEQHGVTPFRAVRGMALLCLTCLSIVGTLRWLRGRAALSWEVPAAIAGFALATAFGPLSAVQLSIRSQAAVAARILDDIGAGRSVASSDAPVRVELTVERYDELEGALVTLAEIGGEPALRRVLTGATAECDRPWRWNGCLSRLGVYRRGSPGPNDGATTTTYEAYGRFATAAGEVELVELVRPSDWQIASAAATPGSAAAPSGEELVLAADRVELRVGGAVVAQAQLAALLSQPDGSAGQRLPTWTQPLVRTDGITIAELAVTRLDVRRASGRAPEALRLTGIVIWRQRPVPAGQ